MSHSQKSSNEDEVIDLALAILEGNGWIDEPSDELITTLKRLYKAQPLCHITENDKSAVGRPGEILVAEFERERQESWEREQAERWSCPCGVTFGLYPFGGLGVHFYTLTKDRLFDEQVTHCPRCRRNLKKARADHDGQLGFAL